MPKPFASARISEELNTAIEKRSKKTGESRSDIITNALRAYLEADADVPLSPEKRFKALETRVTHLEERLTQPAQMALFDNNSDNVSDNKKKETNASAQQTLQDTKPCSEQVREQWTMAQLKDAGLKRQTVQGWAKKGRLPQTQKGITVYRKLQQKAGSGKQVSFLWEISKS